MTFQDSGGDCWGSEEGGLSEAAFNKARKYDGCIQQI